MITRISTLKSFGLAFLMAGSSCTSSSDWQARNEKLIDELGLEVKELSGLPDTGITPKLQAGEVSTLHAISETELYPGVKARIFYSKGALAARITLAAGAEIPAEELPADRLMLVLDGTISQSTGSGSLEMLGKPAEAPDGTHGGTRQNDLIYLEKGSQSGVKAGENGAQILEVYSPVRTDYLKKAGIEGLPETATDLSEFATPSIESGKVYNLSDLQISEVSEGIFARIINGRNMQLSFGAIDPLVSSAQGISPEEHLNLILRGKGTYRFVDEDKLITKEDLVWVPGNTVSQWKADSMGLDYLRISWPVNESMSDLHSASVSRFQSIIPEGAKPELLIDGKVTKPELIFTEGPKWMNGKLYFSNMYFDAGFAADPKRSSTVEMSPDGSYRNITAGKMQTNGLYPYKNGNLLVCDMMGHQVVEMTTKG